jgi:hypothetical protein
MRAEVVESEADPFDELRAHTDQLRVHTDQLRVHTDELRAHTDAPRGASNLGLEHSA